MSRAVGYKYIVVVTMLATAVTSIKKCGNYMAAPRLSAKRSLRDATCARPAVMIDDGFGLVQRWPRLDVDGMNQDAANTATNAYVQVRREGDTICYPPWHITVQDSTDGRGVVRLSAVPWMDETRVLRG